MEAVLVSVSTGVMELLISKLTKHLGDDYEKLRGIRHQVVFLRDELSAMIAALQMLRMNRRRRLCIDDFIARVGLKKEAATGFNFKGLFLKFKKLMVIREIANEIEQLKAREAQ